MKIIYTIEEMRQYTQELKDAGKTLASIDSAGDLHSGHASLIKVAKDNADVALLSIGRIMDYSLGLKDFDKRIKQYKQKQFNLDVEFCELNGVDVLCNLPDDSWDHNASLDILSPRLKQIAKTRCLMPIITMWSQLLEVIRPDMSVIGRKDFYQNVVISAIIKNLNLPIQTIIAPMVRDSDGVPMNSRNNFLTTGQRRRAAHISTELQKISEWSSYPSVNKIKDHLKLVVNNSRAHVWHIDVCDASTAEKLDVIDRETAIVLGIRLGEIDLTDNILINPK